MLERLKQTGGARNRDFVPSRPDHSGPWGYSFVVGTGTRVTAVIVDTKAGGLLPAQKSQFAWDTDHASALLRAWNILWLDAAHWVVHRGSNFHGKYRNIFGQDVQQQRQKFSIACFPAVRNSPRISRPASQFRPSCDSARARPLPARR